MGPIAWTALVTLASLFLYFVMGLRVAMARQKYKVEAPAMTGHPVFERLVRVQANTLEWLIIFLPSLWLFSFAWGDRLGAAIGAVWVLGRIVYAIGYEAEATRRALGFAIQGIAAIVLWSGALIGAVRMLMVTG